MMRSESMSFSVYYLLDSRFPTEKAYSIQVMHTCESLAKLGHKITLIVPKMRFQTKRMKKVRNPYEFYNIDPIFEIFRVPALDIFKTRFHGKFLAQLVLTISFMISCFILILKHRFLGKKIDVIFIRALTTTFLFALILKKVFHVALIFEAHRFPDDARSKILVRGILRKYDGLITITEALKNLYNEYVRLSYKIAHIPDATNMKAFELPLTKEELRKKLKIPLNAKIVIYAGHLYDWKGVEFLISAMEGIEKINTNVFLYIVGGYKSDIRKIKRSMTIRKVRNITFIGYVPPKFIPLYLKASDIAVLPNPANKKSMYYTSPLKLFEYMAANIPVIASDLPAIREILHHGVNGYLIRPEGTEELSRAILYLIDNKEFATQLSENAFEILEKKYTWDIRGKKIEEYIKSVLRRREM